MSDRSYVPRPEPDDEDEDDTPDVPRGLGGLGGMHPTRLSNAQTPPPPKPQSEPPTKAQK